MHPLSTVVLLLGYCLAIPSGVKLRSIAANQNRLGLVGHQIGVSLAALGWMLRGSLALVIFHTIWLLGARLVFGFGRRRSA